MGTSRTRACASPRSRPWRSRANLGILRVLVALGVGKIVAQAIAIVAVTPLNFVGNKLWSFARSSRLVSLTLCAGLSLR